MKSSLNSGMIAAPPARASNLLGGHAPIRSIVVRLVDSGSSFRLP
jgi:hypothetical protein